MRMFVLAMAVLAGVVSPIWSANAGTCISTRMANGSVMTYCN